MNKNLPHGLQPAGYYTPLHTNTAPRQPKRNNDKRNILIVLGMCVAIIVAGIILAIVLRKSPNAITVVTQPDSASQVAVKLDCTLFSNGNVGATGMVVSAGSCTKGGVRYAIDTFVSPEVRDAWLKAAEPLGVNPKWITSTSVTYQSVTS